MTEQFSDLSPTKRALLELRRMKSRVETLEASQQRASDAIAIIGVGLRLPGGIVHVDQLWDFLLAGKDAIAEIPPDRWVVDDYYDPDPDVPGKMNSRFGGFLNRIREFDAGFFGISPREAVHMDPQQRLLLEVGWEALENCGIDPSRYAGQAAGIFLGINNSDYFRTLLSDMSRIDPYVATGNAFSVSASRLAYLLDFRGPAVAVDTACSSSLVAVHLAMQSLRSGECSVALAGGVNAILSPELTINFCKARMLAPDGRCKSFDAAADGYGRSEGCVLVALKRLSDAVRDGHNILAVIRGSAVNQDGRSGGITAPNGPAQVDIIRAALSSAQLEPSDIRYLEAHGTGTPLGDPIELEALGQVFGDQRAEALTVGTIKANLGHLEAAAGIAGLVKAALVVQHGYAPPQINLERINPHLSLDRLGLEIPTGGKPLADNDVLRAGISSFGLSGTNAHVIVESPPPENQEHEHRSGKTLFTLSARTGGALEDLKARYQTILNSGEVAFHQLADSANVGRRKFEQRLALVASSGPEAAALLAAADSPGLVRGTVEEIGYRPRIALFLSGRPNRAVAASRLPTECAPEFHQAYHQCVAAFDRLHSDLPVTIGSLLSADAADDAVSGDPLYGEVALFAYQYALARQLQHWGVEPGAIAGYGTAETVAACVAGVFDLDTAAELVSQRSALAKQGLSEGSLVAVSAAPDVIEPLALQYPGVGIAAFNGPQNVVLTGPAGTIDGLLTELSANDIEYCRIEASVLWHCPSLMSQWESTDALNWRGPSAEPGIPLLSTGNGEFVTREQLEDPEYWKRLLSRPVRFQDCVQTLVNERFDLVVEIGTEPVLAPLGRKFTGDELVWVSALDVREDPWTSLLRAVARLYCAGCSLDWQRLSQSDSARRVQLPNYPFQRQEYWIKTGPENAAADNEAWEIAVASAERQAACVPAELDLGAIPDKWRALTAIAQAYMNSAVEQLGGNLDRVKPTYRTLVGRWIDSAERQDRNSQQSIDDLVAQAGGLFEGEEYLLDYVSLAGRSLVDVATGAMNALETLFPEGSSDIAERLYRDWPVSRYTSSLAAAATLGAVNGLPQGARLLEIGAGTGGTTSAIIPLLPRGRVSYQFTDISEYFFRAAEEKFSDYPGFFCSLFDMEKEPDSQGIDGHSIDVIIATNVLHATGDIRGVLERLRDLLSSRGVLVISEATTHFPWFDVTTGLIEGWQSFSDPWRSDSPLMSSEDWESALLDSGFAEARSFPSSEDLAARLGQSVVLGLGPALDSKRHGHFARPVEPSESRSASAVLAGSAPSDLLDTLTNAEPEQRRKLLQTHVSQVLAEILRLDEAQLPRLRGRLTDMGIDSLMAIDLSKRLSVNLQLEPQLPATLAFDYPTPMAIADHLDELLNSGDTPSVPESTVPTDAPGAETIAEMSDEDVTALLEQRFGEDAQND